MTDTDDRESSNVTRRVSTLKLSVKHEHVKITKYSHAKLVTAKLAAVCHRSFTRITSALKGLIRRHRIGILIMKLPLSLSNDRKTRTHRIQQLTRKLSGTLRVPIICISRHFASLRTRSLVHRRKKSPVSSGKLVSHGTTTLVLRH